jgi:hypothetical protein
MKSFCEGPLGDKQTGYLTWYASSTKRTVPTVSLAPDANEETEETKEDPELGSSSATSESATPDSAISDSTTSEVVVSVVSTPPAASAAGKRRPSIEPQEKPDMATLTDDFKNEIATITLLEKKYEWRAEAEKLRQRYEAINVTLGVSASGDVHKQLQGVISELDEIMEKGVKARQELERLNANVEGVRNAVKEANERLASAKHRSLTIAQQLEELKKQQEEAAKEEQEAQQAVKASGDAFKELDTNIQQAEVAHHKLRELFEGKTQLRAELEAKVDGSSPIADVEALRKEKLEIERKLIHHEGGIEGLDRGRNWMFDGFVRDKTGRSVVKLTKLQ